MSPARNVIRQWQNESTNTPHLTKGVQCLDTLDPMIEIHYPRRNIVGVPPQWQVRRVEIVKRIDLVANPLPIRDYLRRPLVRRGRWLWLAWDYDSREYRQFYENVTREHWREVPLRVGIRDGRRVHYLGRSWAPTVADRRELAAVLWRFRDRKDVHVYADDLAVIWRASG